MISFARAQLLVLVLVLSSMSALVVVGHSPQATKGPTGKLLQVTGQVTVNETETLVSAKSNSIAVCGNTSTRPGFPRLTTALEFDRW